MFVCFARQGLLWRGVVIVFVNYIPTLFAFFCNVMYCKWTEFKAYELCFAKFLQVVRVEMCVYVILCQWVVREKLKVSCVGRCEYADKVKVWGC